MAFGTTFVEEGDAISKDVNLDVFVTPNEPAKPGGIWVKTDTEKVVDSVEIVDDIVRNYKSMPTPRWKLGTASVGSKIYCIGGNDGTGRSNVLEIYDTDKNTWSIGVPMPTKREVFGCVTVAEKIYCIGGAASTQLTVVEVYDTKTDTWSTGKPMPTSRDGFTCSVVNSKIYCIGGWRGPSLGCVKSNEILDTELNTWSKGLDVPYAVYGAAGCALGEDVYYIGGFNAVSSTEYVYCYNSVSNTWLSRATLVQKVYNAIAEPSNGKVCLIGGTTGSTTRDFCFTYDPTSNLWAQASSMPTARQYLASTTVGDDIYCIGGYSSSPVILSIIEKYNAEVDSWGFDWFVSDAISSKPSNSASVAIDGKIYYIGGYRTYLGFNKEVNIYDTKTGAWRLGTPMPTPRESLTVSIVNNKIYCTGGNNSTGSGGYVDVMEVYDIETNSWSVETPIPTPRLDMVANAVGENIYYCYGYRGANMSWMQIYDTVNKTWSTGQSAPSGKVGVLSCTVNDKIYYIGGTNDTSYFNDVSIYDPLTNSWSSGSPMPTRRRGHKGGLIGNRIYCFNGRDTYATTSVLEIYDVETDSWTLGGETLKDKYTPTADAVGNIFYCLDHVNSVLVCLKLSSMSFADNALVAVLNSSGDLNAKLLSSNYLRSSEPDTTCISLKKAYYSDSGLLSEYKTKVSLGDTWSDL